MQNSMPNLPKKGWSLTELMVVLVIIGILTTVAVPQYKRYVMSARVEQVYQIVTNFVQQSVDYAQNFGYFPTMLQLTVGPSAGKSANFAIAASTHSSRGYSPYLNFLTGGDVDLNNACGRMGVISAQGLNRKRLAPEIGYFEIVCVMGHVNNAIESKCFQEYGSGYNGSAGLFPGIDGTLNASSPLMAQYLPAIDLENASSTTGDKTNLVNYVNYLKANATCM